MNRRIVDNIAINPTRALEWPTWITYILVGLYILSPFYILVENGQGGNGTVVANVLGSNTAILVYGASLLLVGMLGLIGLVDVRSLSQKLRRFAAFSSFILTLYFTFLRIIVIGPENLVWTAYFLLTCSSAIIYLRLKWESK